MNEKTVIITERNGDYQIQNNGISEFALLGILECIVFDIKSARQKSITEQTEPSVEQNSSSPEKTETSDKSKEIQQETKRETIKESAAPELRTRINNAIKAIRGLGGRIEDVELNNLTDEELRSELEELTEQYKRLKNSKASR